MYKQLGCCILSLMIVPNVFAQDNWGRYSWGSPDREGFTVLLPTIPKQIVKENGEQGISAFTGNGDSAFIDFIRFEVTFRDGVSKEEFDRQIKAAMNIVGGGQGAGSPKAEVEAEYEEELNKNRVTKDISICGYAGIEFGNSASVQQFFLVRNRLYHVLVTGANKSNSSVEKFLKSFTLINPWEEWKGMRTNENSEGLDRDSPFAPEVCKNIDSTKINKGAVTLPRNSALRLISQPTAVYPEEAKRKQIQGTVSLQVMFLKDGTIGAISVVKGINKELDESAVRAVKQIKFEPQRRNGRPVNARKTIQYTFTLY